MAIDFEFITGNSSLFEIVLPLVLIFTIIFAVLQSTKILGGKKNIDAVISLVFGLFLIRSTKAIEVINAFLPNIALVVIVILMILLLIGVFLGEKTEWAHGFKGLAAIIAIVLVLWIFGETYWKSRFGIPNIFDGLSSQTKGILVFIAILIVVIYFVTREGGEKKNKWEQLGDTIFKK